MTTCRVISYSCRVKFYSCQNLLIQTQHIKFCVKYANLNFQKYVWVRVVLTLISYSCCAVICFVVLFCVLFCCAVSCHICVKIYSPKSNPLSYRVEVYKLKS